MAVIVSTHYERLPEAVRRLRIACKPLAVTRRPESVVEVRTLLNPSKPTSKTFALTRGTKLTPLAALAFFDDREKSGDVLPPVNKYGGWATRGPA